MTDAETLNPDRTVHGKSLYRTADIVRYDPWGHWYLEYRDGTRTRVTVRHAAALAAVGEFFPGRLGGRRFDSLVRQIRRERAT